jgi:hypothetical protein
VIEDVGMQCAANWCVVQRMRVLAPGEILIESRNRTGEPDMSQLEGWKTIRRPAPQPGCLTKMATAAAKEAPPPISPAEVESPIINSPFVEPQSHWQIERGKPPVKAPGRRRASYFYRVPEHAGRGRKNKSTPDMFEAEKASKLTSLLSTKFAQGSKTGATGFTVPADAVGKKMEQALHQLGA